MTFSTLFLKPGAPCRRRTSVERSGRKSSGDPHREAFGQALDGKEFGERCFANIGMVKKGKPRMGMN
jgi:hypothetical protein